MAYFIETHNLSEANIRELSSAAKLYSIAHIPLAEKATKTEYSTFLEYLKAPFVRLCIQRILSLINEDNTIDLNYISNKFYNEQIIKQLNELIHGSDEFNRNVIFYQVKKQLKKDKKLLDKFYREMLKEKLIPIDNKIKIDKDKIKISKMINEIHRILANENDRRQQERLVEIFNRIDM